ncbi:MAG: hypothetical protein EOO39_01435 [Cytophagaceae bacterium]|nr:MAG: hypothetical protein EOO39_01435 [Cytophagaceae bacterium]
MPILFYGGCLGLAGWLWASTYNRTNGAGLASDTWFGLVCLILLCVGRLPGIIYSEGLNPDENQLLAQAITLLHDPVYWQSVDGTTIGPINSYLLCWPGLLGMPLTYATARLTGLALIAGTLIALYKGLRYVVDQQIARRAVILLLVFYVFTRHPDFQHFSSELLAILFLTATWWQLMRGFRQVANKPTGEGAGWSIGAAGLLAGLVPYAKLQPVPIAAALALYGLYRLVLVKQWKLIGLFVVAGLLPTALLLTGTLLTGVTDRFWLFYIESNLFSYGEYYKELFPLAQQPLWQKVGLLPTAIAEEKMMMMLVISTLFSLLLLLLRPTWPVPKQFPWVGIAIWFAAALFCYLKPGTYFVHHLQLLLVPLVWLLAMAQETIRRQQPAFRFYAVQTALPAVLCALVFVGHAIRYRQTPGDINGPLWAMQTHYVRPQSSVVQAINQYKHPDDKLVVWGWNMSYHVDTQLAQGVSENHSFRSIMPHSLLGAYQRKYLEDIKRTQPALFVDATGPSSLWMTDTARFRHERFPALDQYVRAHYTLMKQIGTERIYLRNDRTQALSHYNAPPVR